MSEISPELRAYLQEVQAHADEMLLGLGMVSHQDLPTWKRIIGMRNALVHDYLNVDRQIVLAVLRQRAYRQLLEFIRRAGEAMNGKHN